MSIISDMVESNSSEVDLPLDMRFNGGHLLSIVGYSFLFIFSAIGNCTVLAVIVRRRHSQSIFSRIDFMLLHLSIADLLVTFLMMPLEVVWNATVSWRAGDTMCRVMAFFRTFGLFLSSFVLVCLAIDRYMAVKYPLQNVSSVRRGRILIVISWVLSTVCSFPQAIIFHVAAHPKHPWYTQCVMFKSFPSHEYEIAYYVFGMLMMYALPFFIILLLYCGIVVELYKRTRSDGQRPDGLRRSGPGNLEKAREKTLKMTIYIVVIFFICWTPYYVMCLWYWIDPSSAEVLDPKIQKGLFLFASTNSTANPIVYGVFHIKSTFSAPPERSVENRESFYTNSSMNIRGIRNAV